jgi:hypothetical protein
VKRLVPLFALAAFCVASSPVPYDAGLADSARTILKMTRDNTGVVTAAFNYNPTEQGFTFYPRLTATGFDYGMGFMVSSDGLYLKIRALSYDGGAGALKEFGSFVPTLPNEDPLMPSWSLWPTKDNPTWNSFVLLMAFDSLYPLSSNMLTFVEGQLGSPPVFSMPGGNTMHSLLITQTGFNGEVIGASADAYDDPVTDYLQWLARENGGSHFREFWSTLSSAGIVMTPLRGPSQYFLDFIPSGVKRVQYFYDRNQIGDPARMPNASYASWHDSSGKWICYRWDVEAPLGTYAGTQLPIDHRIDAMLSTGQLLSTENGTGRLYGRNGVLLATFPLGTLRFLSEEYVGGEARTWFCQYLPYDNQMHFNVYWIRTDAIAGLGG